jgi:hypothetical protein
MVTILPIKVKTMRKIFKFKKINFALSWKEFMSHFRGMMCHAWHTCHELITTHPNRSCSMCVRRWRKQRTLYTFPLFEEQMRLQWPQATAPKHTETLKQNESRWVKSRDDSVGIARRLRAGRQGVLGFDSWRELGIFLFKTAFRPALAPTQPPIQWVPRALSLRIKRPESEAYHTPPYNAEVKECVELYLHSPIRLHDVVLG